jgi:hypothetical protein
VLQVPEELLLHSKAHGAWTTSAPFQGETRCEAPGAPPFQGFSLAS